MYDIYGVHYMRHNCKVVWPGEGFRTPRRVLARSSLVTNRCEGPVPRSHHDGIARCGVGLVQLLIDKGLKHRSYNFQFQKVRTCR